MVALGRGFLNIMVCATTTEPELEITGLYLQKIEKILLFHGNVAL